MTNDEASNASFKDLNTVIDGLKAVTGAYGEGLDQEGVVLVAKVYLQTLIWMQVQLMKELQFDLEEVGRDIPLRVVNRLMALSEETSNLKSQFSGNAVH